MKNDSKRTLTPKLRFPAFRDADGWAEHTLRDVTTQLLDGDWIESKDQSDSGFRLIQTGNIGVGTFIPKTNNARYVSEETFWRLGCTEVFPDDCLISRLPDPAGRSCVLPDVGSRMITAVDCTIVRFDTQKVVPHLFVAHSQTDGYFREIAALSSGSTRQRVSRENLANITLALPQIAEQQKIADCLTSLDELIAAHCRKLEALRVHKKRLMQQLFPREGQSLPRLRFPEFRHTQEWEETSLGQIVDPSSGSTPSKNDPAFWNGSIPWVSAKDMKQLFLNDTEDHITAAAVANGAKQVPAGTVLILTRGMTLLKDIPICFLRRPMAFNQDVKALRPKTDLDDRFLPYLLMASKQRLLRMVDVAGHGTGRLDTEKLKTLEVMLPQRREQERIADCLTSLEDVIAAESEMLAALKTHKKGLMQQLFPSPEERL